MLSPRPFKPENAGSSPVGATMDETKKAILEKVKDLFDAQDAADTHIDEETGELFVSAQVDASGVYQEFVIKTEVL